MRKAQPRPKVESQAPIDERLRKFLAEVDRRIKAGDESAMLASDDLLQCEGCYGGRKLAGEELFSFTYFPGPTIKRKWVFDITSAEIARVADGTMTSLDLWACADPNCGSMFPTSEDRCFYCDYVDDNPRLMPRGAHSSRRTWALEYFAINPTAHPFLMIGDFNGTGLGKTLGYFTLAEARAIKGDGGSA